MMKAFKILWSDTTLTTLATYNTVAEAVEFGKAVANDFKVIDSATGEVMSHYIDYGYSDYGFANVGGMTYEQVRRMGRE